MRNHVRNSRSERTQPAAEEGHEHGSALAVPPQETPDASDTVDALETENAEDAENAENAEDPADTAEFPDEDFGDTVRLRCPDCGQPIAVFAGEDHLPEHALCPTPWNPFGLTGCPGAGRAVADARPVDGERSGQDQDLAVLLALPAELDWRTQPFSHAGGAGTRPVRVPEPRLAA
jgi:hypothetical protein